MEDWVIELQGGRPEAAWDRLLERYRRLIFAAIRHYAQDYDEVMDVFARLCEVLREDDLARLRCYVEQPIHSAFFFFKQKTAYEIGLGIPAEPLFRSLQVALTLILVVGYAIAA